MLDKNGNRMLAYMARISNIKPIDGADKIVLVQVNDGWDVIAKKEEFKVGDLCAFFEIDSRVPSDNPAFSFLANRDYKIKTYKLSKFGVTSAGLALPLSTLNLNGYSLGDDLTDVLNVEYAVKEDNDRKAKSTRKKSPWMKFPLFRWLYFKFKKIKEKDDAFPSIYISKTDEERIQNMPYILKNKNPFVATEKIDGTSTTYLLVRKRRKFYICSRNRVIFGDSIYTENEARYEIRKHLNEYLNNNPSIKWVCIQGESYGEGWQSNPLKIKGHDFAAFNFIDSNKGRWGSLEAKKMLEQWGIPWVPIVNPNFILPDTVDELLLIANGKSLINKDLLREGLVFRSLDGKISFKAVSPEYLMKHKL